jgi:hypothetical protein
METIEVTEKKSLVSKLSEVMKEVKYIEKKGFNAFHRYKYATESDVAERVREVLAKENVMMIPSMVSHETREHINAKGKTEYIATVNMEFTFYDGDSGEKITFLMAGEGQDAGDKAIYKAVTGAQKYALMKVFMIPTGDDPEADVDTDERNYGGGQQEQPRNNNNYSKLANPKQISLIKFKVGELAKLHTLTNDEAYERLQMKETDLEKLNSKQASDLIDKLSGWIDTAKQNGA